MKPSLGGAVLAALCALGACYSADVTRCPTVDCPKEKVCDQHGGCAYPEQLSLCDGKPDNTPCSYSDLGTQIDGVCAGGLCIPIHCGDNVVTATVEACDDGNNESGDGCSADCRSLEVCGNG